MAGVVVVAVGLVGLLGRNSDGGGDAVAMVVVPTSEVVSTSTTATSLPPIFVQVSGEVRVPGVYEVPAGSRLFEVLERAGGVTSEGDPEALPLAQMVGDGARVVVPKKGEEPVQGVGGSVDVAGGTGYGAMGGSGSGPVSLSIASAAELESLPGIGPVTAGRIIAYRDQHGPFQAVDELQSVPGIGPATMERLRALVVP